MFIFPCGYRRHLCQATTALRMMTFRRDVDCDAGGSDGAAASARRRGGATFGGGSACGSGRAAVGRCGHVCDGRVGRTALGGAVGGHGSAAIATQRRAVAFLL